MIRMTADLIFDYLFWTAGGIFVFGWILVIVDAISGFRIIEKLPRVGEILGVAQTGVWAVIATFAVYALIAGVPF